MSFETKLGCLRSGPEGLRYPPHAWPKFREEPVFPSSFSYIEERMPEVYDQGNIGSCTAQAVSAALEYVDRRQPGLSSLGIQPKPPYVVPSRLGLYYTGRALVGMQNLDWGLAIPNCIDAVCKYGIIHEEDWPYDTNKFAVEPPEVAYVNANNERLTMYPQRITQDIRMVKTVLSFGYPVVFGLSIENLFIQYVTDTIDGRHVIKMPRAPYTTVGEHAQLIVGWDDRLAAFRVRNSWTRNWGDGGYCWIPYLYVLSVIYGYDFFYFWGTTN